MFAVYAAYNVFVIIRGRSYLPAIGLVILAAMVILFLYYTFFLRRLPLFPRAVVFLPLIALILFALSLIIEIILFLAYGMLLEDSVLRTVVIRPVFYFGFIGLSAHFLFPPEIVDE